MNTRRITILVATLVSIATFALLFGGLYDLALRVGFHTWQAWLFPIAVDLAALTFLIATLDKRVTGKSHAFLWFAAAVAEAVSVLGQFLAHPATEAVPYAPWIASWPAISLLLVQHTLWIVAKDTLVVQEVAQEEAVRTEVLATLTKGGQPGMLDKAVEAMRIAQEAGERMTGGKMAEILGLHKDNGSPHYSKGLQWMKRAEEVLADAT